jgi:deoxyribodipyrimidine photo-lyase
VDADLANNTLGWQWTAGCGADAAPYLRVFNPVRQADRFDPGRAYLRRWLPELAALPDRWIHRPWEASSEVLAAAGVELGRHYPRPIVALEASRDAALAAYAAIGRPRLPGAG